MEKLTEIKVKPFSSQNILHFVSDKGSRGNVVNPTLPSLHGRSIEIKLAVPLTRLFIHKLIYFLVYLNLINFIRLNRSDTTFYSGHLYNPEEGFWTIRTKNSILLTKRLNRSDPNLLVGICITMKKVFGRSELRALQLQSHGYENRSMKTN